MTYHCSLCQDTLLRHIRQGGLYWFCPSCRQEMPRAEIFNEIATSDIWSAPIKQLSSDYTRVPLKAPC